MLWCTNETAVDAARDRAKMLRESILKLDKYREALSSKKRRVVIFHQVRDLVE
jgi:hypothetical protein